jgi:hypothetical protein
MTQKVHQTVKPGIWSERDTSLLLVTGDFSVPLWSLPSSAVYDVVKTLQTRGTIIGISTDAKPAGPGNVPPAVPGTEASVILGHAAGSFDPASNIDVLAELNALMPAGYVVTRGTMFTVS